MYELLPREYINSYHWINVGVSAEEGNKLNPLESIIKTLDEDDFVVVKLDIDTPSVELPLVRQLLQDKDGIYSKIIDQFYFEHHVHLGGLKNTWGREGMFGTVKDSLELFSKLTAKSIPAHYWPSNLSQVCNLEEICRHKPIHVSLTSVFGDAPVKLASWRA